MTDTAVFPVFSFPMSTSHKNKTFATLLAAVLGVVGVHRFYMGRATDRLGLLHVASLPMAGLIVGLAPGANWFYKILPLLVSALMAIIEALVIGLTPDEKWDAAMNPASGQRSASNWPLALLLVATTMAGATLAIAVLARLFDLLYTGGAYG